VPAMDFREGEGRLVRGREVPHNGKKVVLKRLTEGKNYGNGGAGDT